MHANKSRSPNEASGTGRRMPMAKYSPPRIAVRASRKTAADRMRPSMIKMPLTMFILAVIEISF